MIKPYLQPYRTPSVEVRQSKQVSDSPRLRYGGKWVESDHPSYEIIKRIILRKYK